MYYPRDRQAWRSWLAKYHRVKKAVWLIYYKPASGKTRVSYNDAVDEAICFGWIDSKPNTLDEFRSIQFFAPRNPKSSWSKINKQRVERLMALTYFTAFPPSSKKNILEWIHNAKLEGTRMKRIEQTVELAAKNIRANHYRQPKNK